MAHGILMVTLKQSNVDQLANAVLIHVTVGVTRASTIAMTL